MCDEIAIINKGEVVARDKTATLIGQMDAKTLVIHPEGPLPDAIALPDGVSLDRRRDGSLALGYRTGRTSAGAILSALTAAGVTIRDVASEEARLEDVFLALTSSATAPTPVAANG